MGTTFSSWTARAGDKKTTARVPNFVVSKKRLEKFVSNIVRHTPVGIDKTNSFGTFEEAAVAAAREIFYVSTLTEKEFNRLIDEEKYDLRGTFDAWGDFREYGIAIYKKSDRFGLTWRRHGDALAATIDDTLNWGTFEGGVHSHATFFYPEAFKQAHMLSLNDFEFATSTHKNFCLVHTKEVRDIGGLDRINNFIIQKENKFFVGVLQTFDPTIKNTTLAILETVKREKQNQTMYEQQTAIYSKPDIKASITITDISINTPVGSPIELWASFPDVLLK